MRLWTYGLPGSNAGESNDRGGDFEYRSVLKHLNTAQNKVMKLLPSEDTNQDHSTSCSLLLFLAHLRARQPLWSHDLLNKHRRNTLLLLVP